MGKTEADNIKKIEIWWLLRDMKDGTTFRNKTISWGENGDRGSVGCEIDLYEEPYARFHYTQTDNSSGEKKDFNHKYPLIKTPCHFGNYRYWFECSVFKSGVYCGRRVGVLYKDGDLFACRHCYELTYSSRNENTGYKHYPLFKVIELQTKIEKLEIKTKRKTWRGRPTRKQRKLENLYRQTMVNYRQYEECEKRSLKD